MVKAPKPLEPLPTPTMGRMGCFTPMVGVNTPLRHSCSLPMMFYAIIFVHGEFYAFIFVHGEFYAIILLPPWFYALLVGVYEFYAHRW